MVGQKDHGAEKINLPPRLGQENRNNSPPKIILVIRKVAHPSNLGPPSMKANVNYEIKEISVINTEEINKKSE